MQPAGSSPARRVAVLVYGVLLLLLIAFPAHLRDRFDDFTPNLLTRKGAELADQLVRIEGDWRIERVFDDLRARITAMMKGD